MLADALNRSFTTNHGLVTPLEEHGWPVREGSSMDPAIVEGRKFYDTLQAPNVQPQTTDYPDPFTGAPPSSTVLTAPMTLDAWKTTFNIPPRLAGESLEAYRVRAGVVVYYNKNELGLGREMGCATFDDGLATDGVTRLTGVACYVTNYGTVFRDVVNSLPLAVEGLHPKNTVCISWRPSMAANYQVQFYTYNGDGDRREWAQLDSLGPRPLPEVCMNCHGGSYDSEKHLAKFARFLPLDPNVVVWADSGAASRAAQEESIRKINELSTKSPLTMAQNIMLDQLYSGKVAVAGTASATEWAPPNWNDTPEHRQLFDKVLKPNCTTCHAAMQNSPSGDVLPISISFQTPALLDALPGPVCGTFQMPNSQATLLNFWEPPASGPLTAGGKTYDTAAEMMFDKIGMPMAMCNNLDDVSSCNRGPNPDALCGNDFSGRACNRVTGQCVPDLKAPRERGMPNGVCKTDKTRNCPYPEACVPSSTKIAGLEGYDGVCMP